MHGVGGVDELGWLVRFPLSILANAARSSSSSFLRALFSCSSARIRLSGACSGCALPVGLPLVLRDVPSTVLAQVPLFGCCCCCWGTAAGLVLEWDLVRARDGARRTWRDEALQLRLPTFWRKNPQLWVDKVEATFDLHISSEVFRFRPLLCNLSPEVEVAQEVANVIAAPLNDAPYQRLKQSILDRTTTSESARLRHLLPVKSLVIDAPPSCSTACNISYGQATSTRTERCSENCPCNACRCLLA
ncbi:hypothetical protein HPB50_010562 [Hyalomma asiaticum]|uniref:Uncharacterized protein n=1 Tax=Hyalomma asiaticum TaxID=266040 RepID=A0ACB7S1U8_HYAAI|nr:hypothetical protein HPB50_010562 [Hyalomma asiaticum]